MFFSTRDMLQRIRFFHINIFSHSKIWLKSGLVGFEMNIYNKLSPFELVNWSKEFALKLGQLKRLFLVKYVFRHDFGLQTKCINVRKALKILSKNLSPWKPQRNYNCFTSIFYFHIMLQWPVLHALQNNNLKL